ncbi:MULTISPECIES: hypothetical protein [unclassified Caballeronia]|uniref:hypothetical protein n=1 Tax=unclassified Caballeronia TaxID=2646786 RepID=UPI00158B3D19|nr:MULTISPECIES: hypothetical protein [unclassified Caballeronia]QSN61330.1 hypothetical protein JYK05_13610 [Caballeronia sp. M1242]
MSVQLPGVSERVFEFAFNSEFCAASGSTLVGCPYIPTQNQEKRLGYDVSFKLSTGKSYRSLYLQHKVSRRVDGSSPSNKHFRAAVGSPYFAFSLDVDQYNLIHRFSQKRSREFYYCAPIFTRRSELDTHFRSAQVVSNSAWIDVSGCASIPRGDEESHCIVYDPALKGAARFSQEPQSGLKIQRASVDGMIQSQRTVRFDAKSLREEYEEFFETIGDWWDEGRRIRRRKSDADTDFRMKRQRPARRKHLNTPEEAVSAIRELTSDYLGVTWLVHEA